MVSDTEVGTLFVLHTKVVPAGFVPALANPAKLTVVVGQVLVAVVRVMSGAGVVTVKVATAEVIPQILLSWNVLTLYFNPLLAQLTLLTDKVVTEPEASIPAKPE